ncbi:MAG: hypothetical protein K0Q59_6065, partial [Paenibacillus sp.]|nr:hypothetical protein [Paenibacillus sp.]
MGGFPGGGGMPGMNGQQTANTDANRTAAIKAAAMLGLLLLASVFVVLFRRRRF